MTCWMTSGRWAEYPVESICMSTIGMIVCAYRRFRRSLPQERGSQQPHISRIPGVHTPGGAVGSGGWPGVARTMARPLLDICPYDGVCFERLCRSE